MLTNTYAWTYDNLGRLTEEDLDSTDNALDFTATYTYDLTGNRTQYTRDDGRDGTVDETPTYFIDTNDRLLTEELDTDGLAGAEVTTSYTYDHTQQAGKTVTNTDNSKVETAFTYDLQGRMETATITTKDTAGVATRIEKTTYDYDATGIRTSALQEIDTDADQTWDSRTLTEFLVDHRNHTGYQQVVRETQYDADSGLVTKTVDDSFGHDEITQTTQAYDATGNPDGAAETLVFGHDGHGNVRVLTDLAAAVVQLFVFDAYGQMLALYNGAGTLLSGGNGTFANASLAATNLLYSGEQFDTRIGQQYLRARYYNAANGTFNRLDPFFGNLRDPQSFHKYLFAHADPVNGIDPTGLEVTLGGLGVSMSIGGAIGGLGSAAALHASGQQITLGGVAAKAAIGAIMAPIALVSPAIGLGLAAYGLYETIPWTIGIMKDPNKSCWQKTEAAILAVAAVWGAKQSGRHWNLSRRVAPRPPQIDGLNGNKIAWIVGQTRRAGVIADHVEMSLPASLSSPRASLGRLSRFWQSRQSIMDIFNTYGFSRHQFTRRGRVNTAPPGYSVSLGGKFRSPTAGARYIWALGRDGFIRIARFARNQTDHEQLTGGVDGIIAAC